MVAPRFSWRATCGFSSKAASPRKITIRAIFSLTGELDRDYTVGVSILLWQDVEPELLRKPVWRCIGTVVGSQRE